jgi:hypothetical protein
VGNKVGAHNNDVNIPNDLLAIGEKQGMLIRPTIWNILKAIPSTDRRWRMLAWVHAPLLFNTPEQVKMPKIDTGTACSKRPKFRALHTPQ